MSSKRQADMADIQNAIETGLQKKQDAQTLEDQLGVALISRGLPDTGKNRDLVRKELEEQQTLEDQNASEAEKAEAAQRKADEDAANADQALELKRRSLLKAQALKAYRTSGAALGSVQNGLGRLPMPTGLWLPVLTLLILTMLLVKINGNTRLGWLWLVVTGNAALPDSSSTVATTPIVDSTGTVGASGDFGPGVAKGGGAPSALYLRGYVPLEMDEW